jgi:excisionase family DNA binding protein
MYTMNEPTILTVVEVAKRLKISRGKAYGMAQQGQLPVVRLGRSVRIPAREFEDWLERRTEGGDR